MSSTELWQYIKLEMPSTGQNDGACIAAEWAPELIRKMKEAHDKRQEEYRLLNQMMEDSSTSLKRQKRAMILKLNGETCNHKKARELI